MPDFYAHVFRDAGASAKGAVEQVLKVAIGTEDQSNAIVSNSTTQIKFVRCWADADCYIAWGADPTADADTGLPIGGGHGPEYLEMAVGDKISVIAKV
jgi:hypothetical protein